jgi:glycosyltransferase involved in cell wall biosynthesis
MAPPYRQEEKLEMDQLIFGFSGKELEKNISNIINDKINRPHVIYINDNHNSDDWEIANDFATSHPDRVTLAKCHRRLTKRGLQRLFYQLSDVLTDAQKAYMMSLDANSSLLTDRRMDANNLSKKRKKERFINSQMLGIGFNDEKQEATNSYQIPKTPLVTITVHNYNYGRFLEECLESVLNQSYSNIEVIFSDNASVDNSWGIACKYAKRFPHKMTVIRNNRNRGPFSNLLNCYRQMRGRLRIEMCSDDVLFPDAVKTCVNMFKHRNDLGFVMFHREIIDEKSVGQSEKPFYNETCVIPGIQQASVYMMAAVNPSISQVCYDNEKLIPTLSEDCLSRWWGSRIQDFKICLSHPIGYISFPLIKHRVHNKSDSIFTKTNLLEIVGPYLLNLYFLDISKYNETILSRNVEATKKLASLSIRYSANFLMEGNVEVSRQYMHLSQVFDHEIIKRKEFEILSEFHCGNIPFVAVIGELTKMPELIGRRISYDPPLGSEKFPYALRSKD